LVAKGELCHPPALAPSKRRSGIPDDDARIAKSMSTLSWVVIMRTENTSIRLIFPSYKRHKHKKLWPHPQNGR
jgi:hypothetical protein